MGEERRCASRQCALPNNCPCVGPHSLRTPLQLPMPMALPTAVLNNRRAIAAAVAIQLMAVLGVLTIRHSFDHHHHAAPTEALAQTTVSEGDGFNMPPPMPLPIQEEGQKSEEYLRTTLGKLGEDQNPNPANQGLKDLNAKIAAKDPI